jgi:hypothetical protein
MERQKNVYGTLLGKALEKWLFVRPRRRWKDMITMDTWEVGFEHKRWMELTGVVPGGSLWH